MLLNKRRGHRTSRLRAGIGAACSLLLLVLIGLVRAQSPPPGTSNQTSRGESTASRQASPPAKPLVLIDPAHGGGESGAVLNPTLLEKDVTLALARRLRQALGARGIAGELVRDDDSTLSTDDRAARANGEHPGLYLCLHASSLVGSTHVVTAMLAEEDESQGPFLDWASAQSGPLPTSAAVQRQLVASLENGGLRARALAARLRPLNNIAVPAVAVEVSPTEADVSELIAPDFEETIASALANGIARLVPTLAAASRAAQP